MKNEIIYLADRFPFLKKNGNTPTLKLLIPEEIPNYMPKRPCMLLCPGGGCEFCSPRNQDWLHQAKLFLQDISQLP